MSLNIAQADSESEMPESGRWRLSRGSDKNEADEEIFSKLIALGYLQGYYPAPKLMNVTVNKKDLVYNGLNL